MTWKLGMALALSGLFVTGTAVAQTPSGGTSGGTSGAGPSGTSASPGSGSTEMNTPGSSKSMDKPSSMDKSKSMDKSRSMEQADKQVGNKQQVRSVQEALKDKGFDPGAIDGAMGPRTTAALREFQQAEGLRVTGRVDEETRSKLGI